MLLSIQNCRLRTGSRIRAGFVLAVVYLFEASGERLFLLVGGQLRQQQRMAYADLIGIERFDGSGHKVGQLQPRSDE